MSIDSEIIRKFEDILEQKRSKEPLQMELNRAMEEIYPYKKVYSVFKLGQASILSLFKNNVYQYMCNDDKDYIDAIIKSQEDDAEMKELLDKLITERS